MRIPESRKTPGICSYWRIAQQTGIPETALRNSPRLGECITSWAQKLGYSPADKPIFSTPNGWARKREYEHKIDVYLKRLEAAGKKLPENPAHPGSPDWQRVAADSGIPVTAFRRNTSAGRRIGQAVKVVGLEIYPGSDNLSVVSYGELLTQGCEWRAEELKGKSHEKQQLYNTRYQLGYFMSRAGILLKGAELEASDLVGPELLEKFEETTRTLAVEIAVKSSRRKFTREVKRWHLYLLRLCGSKQQPLRFADALKAALAHARMSAEQLAAAANINLSQLNSWLDGMNDPGAETYPDIRRIERALSLPATELTSKIFTRKVKRFSLDVYPEYVSVDNEQIKVRENRRMRYLLRPLLPDDYDEWTSDERMKAASWLIKNLIQPATDWGSWNKTMNGLWYGMPDFPPVPSVEFEDLEEFKCGLLPPDGMSRNGCWSRSSRDMNKNDFLKFFGFLRLPADAEDPRLRGPGIDEGLFSLAVLTCPALVKRWVRWNAMRRRKESGDASGKDSHSFYDLCLVGRVVNHLERGTGWLRQKPQLAGHLKPIPGFIDEAFIERARRDWDGLCDEAIEEYTTFAELIEEVAEEQRDPFEVILPLLDLDSPQYQNPIIAIKNFCRNVIADLPDPARAPIKAAKHVRKYLMTRVLSASALRSRNIRELTYRADNKGELRRRGDKWVIVISYKKFKNWFGSFFGRKKKKHDYVKVLEDIDGLYAWLEEYVNVFRPILLGGGESDVFFFNTAAKPVTSPQEFHAMYSRLTRMYFAHNPYLGRGVPGVKPHGPHAVRDMLATFIIQLTGSYELAAYILTDSEQTVREHYTRFLPKDKTRLVDWFINGVWRGEMSEYVKQMQSTHSLLASHGLAA